MIVELKLLVQIVLFFEFVELFRTILHVMQLPLQGLVRVLDDLVDQGPLFSQSCRRLVWLELIDIVVLKEILGFVLRLVRRGLQLAASLLVHSR